MVTMAWSLHRLMVVIIWERVKLCKWRCCSRSAVHAAVDWPFVNLRLKWKPANENSIDFKIHVEYPPSGTIPGALDTSVKPRIRLLVWQGGKSYTPFEELGVTDEEWFRDFAPLGNSLEGRIVECNYDVEVQQRLGLTSPWRFMRYRTDKPDANHQRTVQKVLDSIRDGITQQELIDRTPYIRQTWMQRKHQ
jgi:mRNA guanylyltransferase